MPSEDNTPIQDPVSEPSLPASTGSPGIERRKLRRERVAWWFKFLMQPQMTVAAIVLVVCLFGVAQRFGWFTSNMDVATEATETDEEVLYICPMVCVPASTEPGKCPVP